MYLPMTRRGEQELDRDGEHVHEAAHPPVARHAGQGPGPAGPHRQPPPLLPQGQGQQPQGRTVEHETEIIAYLPTYLPTYCTVPYLLICSSQTQRGCKFWQSGEFSEAFTY